MMTSSYAKNKISTNDGLLQNIFGNKSGDYIVFCGAGISFNSGMPLAIDFATYVLDVLSCSREYREKILNSDIPFEVFMETLKEQVNISHLMNIFSKGSPNRNHFLLANLAKLGLVKTVITTNFDSLIENAFEIEGLKDNIDYKIYYKDEHFEGINWDSDLIHLIKIHGSAEDTESMAILMEKIASKSLALSRQTIINWIFSTGNHSNVLVLGYSCSDIFDISPQIQNIKNNFKNVIFCDHTKKITLEKAKAEPVNEKKYKNPFGEFDKGIRIFVNTDNLIDYIFNAIGIPPDKYHNLKVDSSVWKDEIITWEKEINTNSKDAIKAHIIARMLIKSTRYIEAEMEMSRSLSLSQKINDDYFATHAFVNLGICHYRMKNFRRSIKLHRKALNLSINLKQKKLEGYTWGNIGNVLYSANKSKCALSFQDRALDIAKKYNFFNLLTNTLGNIGIIYIQSGDLDKAKEFNEQALEVAEDIGDIISISRHNYNLGVVYDKQGNQNVAVSYYLKALDFSEKSAQKTIQTSCCYKLGLYHKNVGEDNRAINFLYRAIHLMSETGEELNKNDCIAALKEIDSSTKYKQKKKPNE